MQKRVVIICEQFSGTFKKKTLKIKTDDLEKFEKDYKDVRDIVDFDNSVSFENLWEEIVRRLKEKGYEYVEVLDCDTVYV